MLPRFTDLLEFIGAQYGDQDEYLVCESCDRRYGRDFTIEPDNCVACGEELHVHVPNSEALVLRWLIWKHEQKWLPQRMYVWPGTSDAPYQYVQWRGREWLRRPWTNDLSDLFAEVDPHYDPLG